MAEVRQPRGCPHCGAADPLRVFYGFPTAETLEQVDAGRGVPGGCFVLPERPDWRGAACKHSWYDSDDPARQELDALIENLRRRRATP